MSEQQETQDGVQEPEKQSTKTWTQSEVDKHTAEMERRVKETYADYDDIKKQLKTLMDEKAERDKESMSEVERINAELEAERKQRQELESYKEQKEKEGIKALVLGDENYSKMPKVYKDAVMLSSIEDEVRASAEEVYKQYKADFGDKMTESFGIPAQKKQPDIKPIESDNPKSLADAMRARVSSLINK